MTRKRELRFIDVPRMFVDDEFQRYKVSKCRNVVVRSFWEHEMANTGEREKQEMIPYFSSKIWSIYYKYHHA